MKMGDRLEDIEIEGSEKAEIKGRHEFGGKILEGDRTFEDCDYQTTTCERVEAETLRGFNLTETLRGFNRLYYA